MQKEAAKAERPRSPVLRAQAAADEIKAAKFRWDNEITPDVFVAPTFTAVAPMLSVSAGNAMSQTYSASALLGK